MHRGNYKTRRSLPKIKHPKIGDTAKCGKTAFIWTGDEWERLSTKLMLQTAFENRINTVVTVDSIRNTVFRMCDAVGRKRPSDLPREIRLMVQHGSLRRVGLDGTPLDPFKDESYLPGQFFYDGERYTSRYGEHFDDETKETILRRDGYQCRCCGSRTNLQVDHVLPHRLGGPATVENGMALCSNCNQKKKNYLYAIGDDPLRTLQYIHDSAKLMVDANIDDPLWADHEVTMDAAIKAYLQVMLERKTAKQTI